MTDDRQRLMIEIQPYLLRRRKELLGNRETSFFSKRRPTDLELGFDTAVLEVLAYLKGERKAGE